jgi:hypothetical protein
VCEDFGGLYRPPTTWPKLIEIEAPDLVLADWRAGLSCRAIAVKHGMANHCYVGRFCEYAGSIRPTTRLDRRYRAWCRARGDQPPGVPAPQAADVDPMRASEGTPEEGMDAAELRRSVTRSGPAATRCCRAACPSPASRPGRRRATSCSEAPPFLSWPTFRQSICPATANQCRLRHTDQAMGVAAT